MNEMRETNWACAIIDAHNRFHPDIPATLTSEMGLIKDDISCLLILRNQKHTSVYRSILEDLTDLIRVVHTDKIFFFKTCREAAAWLISTKIEATSLLPYLPEDSQLVKRVWKSAKAYFADIIASRQKFIDVAQSLDSRIEAL